MISCVTANDVPNLPKKVSFRIGNAKPVTRLSHAPKRPYHVPHVIETATHLCFSKRKKTSNSYTRKQCKLVTKNVTNKRWNILSKLSKKVSRDFILSTLSTLRRFPFLPQL